MGDAVGGGSGELSEALDVARVPLHHPVDGPPPRNGEDFSPVPTRQRDDGWSPARQRKFGLVRAGLGAVRGSARRVCNRSATAVTAIARLSERLIFPRLENQF